MDRNSFESRLRDEGFSQTVIVEREANGRLDLHTHPFEALALILAGEIRIDADGESRLYRVGEVFHLVAEQPHSERYGPEGVRYRVGLR